MRTVALAALAILTAAPESLLEPSFEMSFAAVFGLVALYEWLAARKRWSLSDVSPLWRSLRWSAALVFGAAITTIVASAAVAPLVSVLIMPMVLLALPCHSAWRPYCFTQRAMVWGSWCAQRRASGAGPAP
jgi:predicted membrane metal-binding protein